MIDPARRGHIVVAVDVLAGAPLHPEPDPLTVRMWSLQRSFMYRDMRTIGVDVVPWSTGSTLDQVMHVVPEHRRRTRRRHAVGSAAVTVSAPTVVGAVSFLLVGLLAAAIPVQLAWLPLLAPVGAVAVYLLAIYPFRHNDTVW